MSGWRRRKLDNNKKVKEKRSVRMTGGNKYGVSDLLTDCLIADLS